MFRRYYIYEYAKRNINYTQGVVLIMKSQKLLDYVSSLTPEQVEKLIAHLPQLISLLEEQGQLCLQEQIK